MPSRLTRINTIIILIPSDSLVKIPTEDSNAKIRSIADCRSAGSGRRRVGRAGIPREIEDREKKTVVWYTSCDRMPQKNISEIGIRA